MLFFFVLFLNDMFFCLYSFVSYCVLLFYVVMCCCIEEYIYIYIFVMFSAVLFYLLLLYVLQCFIVFCFVVKKCSDIYEW